MEENDDEETETEIQDKLKEPPAVSARSTTCSSENAIIKPFKKSYSVEATSTTGMWYLHKYLHFCCVAFEIYLCYDFYKVEMSDPKKRHFTGKKRSIT